MLSRSGGIVYHLRAGQYRRGLWQPFRRIVADWLAAWQPPCGQLVIVGPSGGYTLPLPFLQRFDDIVLIEPDPVARWMLQQRFRGLPLRFVELDCVADTGGPARLAAAFPDAAILFSNLIGQVLTDAPSGWREALLCALAERHWASYHDVVSTGREPDRTTEYAPAAAASLNSVLGHFWQGGELTLTDHETFALTGQAGRYAMWALTPQRHHLIEWQCR